MPFPAIPCPIPALKIKRYGNCHKSIFISLNRLVLSFSYICLNVREKKPVHNKPISLTFLIRENHPSVYK